jgi:hypothetical protein
MRGGVRLGGVRFGRSSKAKQHTLAVESSPCHPPIPARIVQAVGSACGERVPKRLSVRTQVCPSGGLALDRDENAATRH